jgi:AraC-like DNA-binding protein
MLTGDLTGATSLSEIALACGLSVGHFSRAFRRSTGLAPHAWLLHIRVEAAKAMLRQREAQLSVIAMACGFADQSHFSRVFTRRVGSSPGAWRKYLSDRVEEGPRISAPECSVLGARHRLHSVLCRVRTCILSGCMSSRSPEMRPFPWWDSAGVALSHTFGMRRTRLQGMP